MENTAARKLKRVLEDYLVIGVDAHKKKHVVAGLFWQFTAHRCSQTALLIVIVGVGRAIQASC